MASDTSVTMTISLQPVISLNSGAKLVITLVGQLSLATTLSSPPITTVLSPTKVAGNLFSNQLVRTTELEFTFGADIAANTILTFSLGTFSLPSSSLPGNDAVTAAIIDSENVVLAPSSLGSFPAIFSQSIAGSTVGLSSSVANAPNISVTVTFSPPAAVTALRLSGLGFVEFAGASAARRLLQAGVLCSNLAYSGAGVLSATYNALDGELLVNFPGGSASRLNQAVPCTCQISGFRNPAASTASAGVIVTTYDSNFAGLGIQSGVVFPPILCAPGYLQTIVGNAVNCAACPKGTYNDVPGAALCLPCPSGSYSSTEAASSFTTCLPCPVATFSNKSGVIDASACNKCQPGTNSSLLGASACAPCASGTYAASLGQQLCDLCGAGERCSIDDANP